METSPASPHPPISRSLFLASIFYGGMVVLAGMLGNKLVALGPLAVEAGIFAFMLLVVTSLAVTELHGQATGRRLVLWGFVPLIASTLLIQLVLALPAAAAMEADRLAAFETVMGQSVRLMIAGLIAYGLSQLLNVTIFSALTRGKGRLLWLRAGVASVCSQIVDTLLFVTISFYGVFPIGSLIAGQMIAKVTLSLLVVPLLATLFVAFGRRLDARRW
ncbi:MAG: hypothetical protein JWL91_2743 [Sphingomonas bacterium]|nr:queuosine precursor transporter [Sphingomonas bacterium]MDB5690867.1 hypothetical protein [Sphingomonas bacterium]